MDTIDFAECSYSVMRETKWNEPVGFITDATRSGARKARASNAAAKTSYSVKLRFPTLEDYQAFSEWYNDDDKRGMFPFRFRDIQDTEASGKEKVYVFKDNAGVSVSNVAGHVIDVSMEWTEY